MIRQNRETGDIPTRFIQLTKEGYARDLLAVCSVLVTKPETLEVLDAALARYPGLLTLEDLVSRFGAEWGFTEEIIRMAGERVRYFDGVAGAPRYG